MSVIDLSAVSALLGEWWVRYDAGDFDRWPELFTDDARFTCRSDSGHCDYEEFIAADIAGRGPLLEWQERHRRDSPYPLRHTTLNLFLTGSREEEADFAAYLFVTQLEKGVPKNLSTGLCNGSARLEDGKPRLSRLEVVLDTIDSGPFEARDQHG